jgi:hypothetical protein
MYAAASTPSRAGHDHSPHKASPTMCTVDNNMKVAGQGRVPHTPALTNAICIRYGNYAVVHG